MRACLVGVLLFACHETPHPTPTATQSQTTQPQTAATASARVVTADGGCVQSCGPPERTICCAATDKCCAEGAAAHFYCYAGPGDCPLRP